MCYFITYSIPFAKFDKKEADNHLLRFARSFQEDGRLLRFDRNPVQELIIKFAKNSPGNYMLRFGKNPVDDHMLRFSRSSIDNYMRLV